MQNHCHRQRRGLLHISGPIFYHRQDIVAVRPVAGRRKAPPSAGPCPVAPPCLMPLCITTAPGRHRYQYAGGSPCAFPTLVILSPSRCRCHRPARGSAQTESGIDGEIERLCCLISASSSLLPSGYVSPSQPHHPPDIIPDARRRVPGSVEPRLPPSMPQHHVDIRRHRHPRSDGRH